MKEKIKNNDFFHVRTNDTTYSCEVVTYKSNKKQSYVCNGKTYEVKPGEIYVELNILNRNNLKERYDYQMIPPEFDISLDEATGKNICLFDEDFLVKEVKAIIERNNTNRGTTISRDVLEQAYNAGGLGCENSLD